MYNFALICELRIALIVILSYKGGKSRWHSQWANAMSVVSQQFSSMIYIQFIALFRQFTSMQKQVWRSRAIRSNRHANIGLASRCSMSRRANESIMFTIVQDCMLPEKSLGISDLRY